MCIFCYLTIIFFVLHICVYMYVCLCMCIYVCHNNMSEKLKTILSSNWSPSREKLSAYHSPFQKQRYRYRFLWAASRLLSSFWWWSEPKWTTRHGRKCRGIGEEKNYNWRISDEREREKKKMRERFVAVYFFPLIVILLMILISLVLYCWDRWWM